MLPLLARVDTELEISDEDVIEVTVRPPRPPQPKSGTYVLSRPRETKRPPPLPPGRPSNDDDDGADTSVSDVIGSLVRLSDGASTPKLRGVIEWTELDPSEAWLVSVITTGMTVAAIMQHSPLGEEATLTLLTRLVSTRMITLVG